MVQPVNNQPVQQPVAPAPAPAPAPANPVQAALEQLSLSNVQRLWNEKVEGQGLFGQIFGRLSYIINKSDAVAKDGDDLKTINLFNQKLGEFVLALSKRDLTRDEAAKNGMTPVKYSDPKKLENAIERTNAAKAAEKAFYEAFKARCDKIAVKDEDFLVYVKAAKQGLKNHANDTRITTIENKDCLLEKIKTSVLSFHGNIYNSMIKSFGSTDIETLSPSAFSERAEEIQEIFPDKTLSEIGAEMKKAIATKDNKKAIQKLATKYASLDSGKKEVAELTKTMKRELEAKLEKVNARIKELCGDNRNGLINENHDKFLKAEKERDVAEAKFRKLFKPGVSSNSARKQLFKADISNPNAVVTQEMKDAHADFVAKEKAVLALIKERTKLDKELTKLQTWDNGNINGGKKFVLERQLHNFAATVSAECAARGHFLNWLAN